MYEKERYFTEFTFYQITKNLLYTYIKKIKICETRGFLNVIVGRYAVPIA